jgi:S1-C subfamily serine protease
VRPLRAAALLLGALAVLGAGPGAEEPVETTAPTSASQEIFARHGAGVVKVEIQEAGSAAKTSIGSGFAVAPGGMFVTNYHVISALIDRPDRYQVKIRDSAGATHDAKVIAFDVVQDLALLRTPLLPAHVFQLHDGPALRKGERLFSLGNPLDLGMSVVEGTYNGLLEH